MLKKTLHTKAKILASVIVNDTYINHIHPKKNCAPERAQYKIFKEKIQLITLMDFNIDVFVIPKLTLQPLIENAIVHGFTKNTTSPTIYICGKKTQDNIIITVEDNGQGMSNNELDTLCQNLSLGNMLEKNSIGLRNVNQRFMLNYGSSYGISVESKQNAGTKITLKIPVSQHEMEESQ